MVSVKPFSNVLHGLQAVQELLCSVQAKGSLLGRTRGPTLVDLVHVARPSVLILAAESIEVEAKVAAPEVAVVGLAG